METYTESLNLFKLLQNDKINTKLWNNCRILNFQKEHFTFYETRENELLE